MCTLNRLAYRKRNRRPGQMFFFGTMGIFGLAMNIFLLFQPCIAEEPIVKLATLSDFPPHCFRKENARDKLVETIPPGADSSQLQGYAWDVVRESYHAEGFTIRLHVAPWSRVMSYIEAGKADVAFPAMKTTEREKKFAFSDEVVIHSAFVVYIRNDTLHPWNGLASLNGKKIVGVKGWAFGKEWEANNEIIKIEAYSVLQGFTMVGKKHAYGMAGYDVPFDYILKINNINQQYQKLPSWGAAQEYVLGRKQNHHTATILSAFDHGKKRIAENGLLDQIIAKWR